MKAHYRDIEIVNMTICGLNPLYIKHPVKDWFEGFRDEALKIVKIKAEVTCDRCLLSINKYPKDFEDRP